MGDLTGHLHHFDINVSDLKASEEFWGWFLKSLGYVEYQRWSKGISWKLGNTYLSIVQTESAFLKSDYSRKQVGLNHLAFHAKSREQVDQMTHSLRQKKVKILYEDRHPYAGGLDYYAVYFEDPDKIKVELVAP